MQDRTLEAVGRVIVSSPAFKHDSTLVWHAGEPCVLPASWYRKAAETISNGSGRRIAHQSFQTNATLIDDEWVELLQEPGIAVGVSLDGPPEIHDRHRKARSGRGTYALTMRGIAKLRAGGIPFHVIAVISEHSLGVPEKLAEAFIESGAASIGLNIEEIDGANETSSLADAANERYRAFLDRFLTALERAGNPPFVREVNRFRSLLASGIDEHRAFHQESVPGAIVSVGVDGRVSTFSPELLATPGKDSARYCFGNVNSMTDIAEMFFNRAFLRAYRQIRYGVRLCRGNCTYFGMCGGGAPANKLGEHGRFDVGETMHCRLTVQTTFETLLGRAIAMGSWDQ